MAKREDDGTVSLATANAFAKKADRDAKTEQSDVARTAHRAIDAAFRSPLSLQRNGQKPLRG